MKLPKWLAGQVEKYWYVSAEPVRLATTLEQSAAEEHERQIRSEKYHAEFEQRLAIIKQTINRIASMQAAQRINDLHR